MDSGGAGVPLVSDLAIVTPVNERGCSSQLLDGWLVGFIIAGYQCCSAYIFDLFTFIRRKILRVRVGSFEMFVADLLYNLERRR